MASQSNVHVLAELGFCFLSDGGYGRKVVVRGEGGKSRDACAAERSELVENVVEEFVEAAIENDLIGDAVFSMFFFEGINVILCNDLCSFLDFSHFSLYLISIVLLAVRNKAIQSVLLNEAYSDVPEIDKRIDTQRLTYPFSQVKTLFCLYQKLISKRIEILIVGLYGSQFLVILFRQGREELKHTLQEGLMIAEERQNFQYQITEYHIIEVVELLRGIFAFTSVLSLYFKLPCVVVKDVVYRFQQSVVFLLQRRALVVISDGYAILSSWVKLHLVYSKLHTRLVFLELACFRQQF